MTTQNVVQWVEWLWNRRVEHWAIHSSTCSFARTAQLFACSALPALLVRSTALVRSLLPCSLTCSWESGFCLWNERVDSIQFQLTVRSTSNPRLIPQVSFDPSSPGRWRSMDAMSSSLWEFDSGRFCSWFNHPTLFQHWFVVLNEKKDIIIISVSWWWI